MPPQVHFSGTGEIRKRSEQKCYRLEAEMVNHYPQGSLINTTHRGGGGGNRNRSVAISLRGRESPKEAKRPEGTQKSAFV